MSTPFEALPVVSRHGLLQGMKAEQDVRTLREVKTRMEKLIAYYSSGNMGEREQGFVVVLQGRLCGVSDACGGKQRRWPTVGTLIPKRGRAYQVHRLAGRHPKGQMWM